MQQLATPVGSASLLASDQAFKRIIDDETVPEGIPWATPYEELENKRMVKVSTKVKSIRGKLNVPPASASTCAARLNICAPASNSTIDDGWAGRNGFPLPIPSLFHIYGQYGTLPL